MHLRIHAHPLASARAHAFGARGAVMVRVGADTPFGSTPASGYLFFLLLFLFLLLFHFFVEHATLYSAVTQPTGTHPGDRHAATTPVQKIDGYNAYINQTVSHLAV